MSTLTVNIMVLFIGGSGTWGLGFLLGQVSRRLHVVVCD